MDNVDRFISRAEADAEPERFSPHNTHRTASADHSLSSEKISDTLSTGSEEVRTRSNGVQGSGLHQTELDRITTHGLLHSSTVGSTYRQRTRRSSEIKERLGAGKLLPTSTFHVEDFLVEFDGPEDSLHAYNWPLKKKLICSVVLAYSTFVASFASAIFSPAISGITETFHVSTEVGVLDITLYIIGFATGPVIWAPMSELSGRKLPLVIGIFGFSIFSIGVAAAKDLQTVMLCRFFAGFFFASPLAVVPACFANMYDHKQRGIAITAFAMAVFVGPFASPFTGGFISMSYLGWRWTMYISAIMGFLSTGLLVLFYEETYAPAILVAKAGRLRRQTHDWRIHAKQEEVEVDLHELITNNFSRPVRMLVTEPTVLLITIYVSFVYGLMYALLGVYPPVFQGVHGMNPGVGGLPFIGLIIGQVIAGIYILAGVPVYNKKLDANNGVPVPEWRLVSAIVGSFAFSGGMFGWTGFSPGIHWMVSTASGVIFGFGLLCIFLQCFNYLIDAYLMFAASVIAANTLLRSFAGGAFPLFATQMFNNLGIQWAGTLLGCLAAIMIPIPIAFYIYGPKLRKKSKFAPTEPESSLSDEESGNGAEDGER